MAVFRGCSFNVVLVKNYNALFGEVYDDEF